jgi:pimaricinolide synthase PimS1
MPPHPQALLRAAVAAVAREDPQRPALIGAGERRSYGELAALFGGLEVGPPRRRALAVDPTVAAVETVLSESLGGADLLLADGRTTAAELERVGAIFAAHGGDGEAARPCIGLTTSGSSGLPKVVELDWESLQRNAGAFAAAAGYGAGDVIWCTTPLAHLYCFGAGVLAGLLSGATVLLSSGILGPAEFAATALAERPTVLLSVPFLFRRYQAAFEADPGLAAAWSVRCCVAAGEPVPADLIESWRRLSGVGLRSHYGLTEGGHITLAGGDAEEGVGRPLADVELRIGEGGAIELRRQAPQLPYRVIGAAPDPEGWCATGDIGHLDEDGHLHVTGRADGRINFAGKKIDPEEVEQALLACAGVADCAVAGIDGPDGERVAAFVVAADGATVSDGELRSQLASRLSPYKLPRHFVRVESIPRTLTGKVRRGELIAAFAPAAGGWSEDLLELVRGEAAATVLGHATPAAIDPGVSFKDLGFDSLAAVELCNRLAAATGLELAATLAFDHPTPAALAAFLADLEAGTEPRPAAAIAARARAEEPIAIVGMACRYPGGVESPQDLWRLLAAGTDAISPFPADRGWDLERLYDPDPGRSGCSYGREGGFLADIAGFDAEHFGIGPREALAMDPQQRLALEASWEAIEDAGLDPAALAGSATGVFTGVMRQDYWQRGAAEAELEPYQGVGSAASIVSGRVAYSFGLEGPALTIDTACSSSLVALHLAAQALRGGECDLALAGGVTAMSTPWPFIEFSRQRGLAADGRCKSFGAGADGTGFAEGVGLLLLERLDDARAAGRRPIALIRASATNQDGASNGLTAPHGPSQERVIRQALANAGLDAAEVDAVEAHGTGTTLGDPIEAAAIIATYGQGREPGAPLRLGSVKSNIGHAQAAAGVAGVIKMALALRHEELPRSLHLEQPTPHVEWPGGAVELLREPVGWERGERPRRAGISSFGLSGTNAHLILEEPPAVAAEPAAPAPATPLPWLLSARSEEALRERAAGLASHLRANPGLDPADVGRSLLNRSRLGHRAAAVAADPAELAVALAALAADEPHAALLQGRAGSGKLAFLFSGQGAQRAAMGRELYETFPAFAAALDEICAELDPLIWRPLREFLFAPEGSAEAELLEHTEFTQPALFAIEVALFRLLESWGVRPDFLIGHSIGELAAAHVAGVLDLPDACKLIAARGALMGALPKLGAMVAIEAEEGEIGAELGEELSIAAINSPTSLVVSGAEDAALELAERWQAKGRKATRLRVSHAFHSALMEPMLAPFAAVAEGLTYGEPQIPIVSNLSGEPLSAEQATDPAYWVAQVREPVRFGAGIGWLASHGAGAFLELGPDAVLSAMAGEGLTAAASEATAAPLLRRGRPEPQALLGALAGAHVGGVEVEWERLFAAAGAQRVPLPTYPFRRRRHWVEPAGSAAAEPAAIGQSAADHPLLGAAISMPGEEDGWLLTGRLSLQTHPWLADHAVLGTVMLPATAFVELALKAAEQAGAAAVGELALEAPLLLLEGGAVQIRVSVGAADESGTRALAIHSRPERPGDPDAEWSRNASGSLTQEAPAAPAEPTEWPPAGAEPLAIGSFYERAAELGIDYGPAFQGLKAVWRRGEDLFAEAELGAEQEAEAGRFGIHPALLDAAFHSQLLAPQDPGAPRVPFAGAGVRLLGTGATALRVSLRARGDDVSLLATDAAGAPVISVDSLALRPIDRSQLRGEGQALASLFEIRWAELPLPAMEAPPTAPRRFECAPLVGLDPPTAAQALCAEVLGVLQTAIAGAEEEGEERTVFVTRSAVAVAAGESPDPAAASVWGLVRAAQAEHPGRFLLLDSDGSEASEAALEAALTVDAEPQLALREGSLSAPRLAPAPRTEVETRPLDPAGAVLVTGGTGALGALFARHLVARYGARRLVLASRRGPEAPGAAELRTELAALGAEAEAVACDITDPAQLAALVDSITAERRLTAVIHCAGVTDDGVVTALDPERLATAIAPKAGAAWHLHELTAAMEDCELVLFSSVAGTFQSPGQGNYAAANAFLDALAQRRAAAGLPALALAWGAWERESEMTSRLGEADRARIARGGIEPLSDEDGLRAFDRARGLGLPRLLPVRLDRAALRAAARAGELAPLLSGLVRAPARPARSGSLVGRLAGVPQAQRQGAVTELVRTHVAAVLGHASAAAIDPDAAFKQLGFDSLATVELRNRLGQASGLRLPSTLVFDHPNTTAVAAFLLTEVEGGAAPAPAPARAPLDAGEPIAIVGMSCRYPGGVASPADLWRLLEGGGDGITAFPADRDWDLERLFDPDPDHPGTSYVREGGFLADAAEFDAEFFGIGPREARAMDPQQRVLLEAAWEAWEDAGIDPASLAGSETGVFAGVMHHDYAQLGSEPAGIDGYQGIGTAGSVLSGRVAYSFGLEGPAVTVDTACSSSLVALHLAAQSLHGGECDLALAGGVTVRATPEQFVEFSRQRALAPDGRCKPFAAAADGTGFSEGVGLMVLERLADARANGHRVLALLRGSAVNQDGASNGLTAPNGPAQERVIRRALERSGLAPAEVDAVEAHGTGTTLGDPIEAGAILATYGQGREGEPLALGSIKSNIGHTMAAAGVAGAIKMTLALRHGELPRSLHLEEPTPHVDWSAGAVELLREPRPWEPNGHPRRAGVSSFGISGTNAHLILEEAPREDAGAPAADPEPPAATPWLLSAKSEGALRASALRLASHLRADPTPPAAAVARALAARARLPHRAAAIGSDPQELLAALDALAAGEPHAALVRGRAGAGRPVFVFSGFGTQWVGMGRELLDSSPVFAAQVAACTAAFDPYIDFSLEDVLRGDAHDERVDIMQVAVFTMTVSLAGLWRAHGVEPAAVVGHSQGEVAAAYVAGALSLEDAARVIALRGQALLEELSGKGGMVSLHLPVEQVLERIAPWGERLSPAAINSPTSTVVAGDPEALEELVRACEAAGVRARRMELVKCASHSSQVERIRERLLTDLAPVEPRDTGAVAFYSAMTGERLDGAELDAEYWYQSMRSPVRFGQAVETLLGDGFEAFVEPSTHPVLIPAVLETVAARAGVDDGAIAAVGTLAREDGGLDRFATALASAHVAGVEVEWEALFTGADGELAALPTYPFQRQRYWLEAGAEEGGSPAAIGLDGADHPLIGAVVPLPAGSGWLLTGRLSRQTHPWLADHAVFGTAILPGTGFFELALRAAEQAGAEAVEELTIEAPLILGERGAVQLQVSVGEADESGRRPLAIHSRPEDPAGDGAEWVRNASGLLGAEAGEEPEALGEWPPPGAEPVAVDSFYELTAALGVDYGPAFQGVRAVWRRGDELFTEAELDPEQAAEAERFGVHPALLDAALHSDFLNQAPDGAPRGPFACSGLRLHRRGAALLRLRQSPAGPDAVRIAAFDAAGAAVASVHSLAIRPIEAAQLRALAADSADSLFVLRWAEVALSAEAGEAEAVRHFECVPDTELEAPAAAQALCAEVLAALQEAIADPEPVRVAFITDGAMAVAEGEVADPAAAAVWGLVRSAQGEHPGRFLLVDSDGSEASRAALVAALEIEGEPQLALREGVTTAPRLAPAAVAADPAPPLDPARTVLLTGGTGAVGSLFARHLIEQHGVRRLILTSRRGLDAPGATELVAALAELGAEVEVAACDVADRAQLAELIAAIPAEHPLGAVFHAAAVFDNGLVDALDPERLATVLGPKADAAWHLHELTRELGCELVFFSSLAGSLQHPGQGNYAAANAFLDALAQRRQAEGLPGRSLAWGLWGAERVAQDDALAAADLARLGREGIIEMSPRQAFEIFDRSRALAEPLVVTAKLEMATLRALARTGESAPLLRGLVRAPARRARPDSLAERLAAVPEAEREGTVVELVRAHAAAVLGHASPAEIDPEAPFKDLGFDSLTAVELRNRLGQASGLRLPATLVFDYPSVVAVAGFLLAEVGGGEAPADTDRKLDAIAGILDSIPAAEREPAARRLRALLAGLSGNGAGAEAEEIDLDSASDEELLRLIDGELGSD